jgi:hypothetical protein
MPGNDHIDMEYAQYPAIHIYMALASHLIVGMDNQNIMMRSPWVDDILGSVNIIGHIVEPSDMMLVHLIILDNDHVNVVSSSQSGEASKVLI